MAKVITRELLAQLGLSITPARDHGFGYTWRGRQWVGPFESEQAALKAAFDEAITIMNTERPNAQVAVSCGAIRAQRGSTLDIKSLK
jgi:hypothetical protein